MGRGFLAGIAVGAAFGVGWVFWAASVLTEPAGDVLRVTGLVAGAGAVLMAGTRASTNAPPAPDASRSASFGAPVFLAIVVAEVVAIRSGLVLLDNVLDVHVLDAAWVALVVGLHFLAMGRFLHWSIAYVVGSVMTAASVVAAAGYAAGWSASAVTLLAALPCAAVLLASSWYGVLSTRRTS